MRSADDGSQAEEALSSRGAALIVEQPSGHEEPHNSFKAHQGSLYNSPHRPSKQQVDESVRIEGVRPAGHLKLVPIVDSVKQEGGQGAELEAHVLELGGCQASGAHDSPQPLVLTPEIACCLRNEGCARRMSRGAASTGEGRRLQGRLGPGDGSPGKGCRRTVIRVEWGEKAERGGWGTHQGRRFGLEWP